MKRLLPFLLALVLLLDGRSLLADAPGDKALVQQIFVSAGNVDRRGLIARLNDAALRAKLKENLTAIEEASKFSRRLQQIIVDVTAVGGTVELTSGGPPELRELVGEEALKLFDVPVAIRLYDGNNPLKGKGNLNTKINDDWLARLAGLTTVTRLDLANCDVHRTGLQVAATMTALESLNLTLTPVTDEDLAPLATLTELRDLSLASTDCTGEGFARLQSLTKLRNLNMHHALTNDAGLAAIAKVGDLERLWIAHGHFTDEGTKHLAAHKHLNRLGIGSKEPGSTGAAIASVAVLPLTELELFDSQPTDEAIHHAGKISTLRFLNISYGPQVTDASIDAIIAFPALEELRIGGAKITDAGAMKLAGIKTLKKLSLAALKKVSPATIDELRKARPDLVIEAK